MNRAACCVCDVCVCPPDCVDPICPPPPHPPPPPPCIDPPPAWPPIIPPLGPPRPPPPRPPRPWACAESAQRVNTAPTARVAVRAHVFERMDNPRCGMGNDSCDRPRGHPARPQTCQLRAASESGRSVDSVAKWQSKHRAASRGRRTILGNRCSVASFVSTRPRALNRVATTMC